MVPCKKCISLAICLCQVFFIKDETFSYGYMFGWGNCGTRCHYMHKLSQGGNKSLFEEVKRFFMSQKGINYGSL